VKVADVKLTWKPSVSVDVAEQTVVVVIDGVEKINTTVAPELEELLVEVKAKESVVFYVITEDNEGNTSLSENYTFSLGDLEAPQPATLLGHEIVAIRDVVDPVDPLI
jgi:hypothetical protein